MAKLLVIDDSRVMRLYLKRCLEKAGHTVEEWDPPSAMEVAGHITASAPDLILSDFQMPGCNGATVARMARKANPDIPLLVLTSFHDADMEAQLLKTGVRRVLTKPIGAKALVEAVEGELG